MSDDPREPAQGPIHIDGDAGAIVASVLVKAHEEALRILEVAEAKPLAPTPPLLISKVKP